jgi:hypothetical protein
MNWQLDKEATLAHYIKLAGDPAWKGYVWRRVNEMAEDYPNEYADLPKLLTEAMQKDKP